MRIRILGAGAGGGFPQWNCNCPNCLGFREGSVQAKARTQSSIAISDNDGKEWVLVNASPDIRSQLLSFPECQPARSIRDTAITGVILVDSQIDHTTGLLMLREGKKLDIYCTPSVYGDLTSGFPILKMLDAYCKTEYHPIDLKDAASFTVKSLQSILFTAIPLEGKAPPYSPNRQNPSQGDNIGLFIQDLNSNQSLFYAPGLGKIDAKIQHWLQKADCLLLDGTFWEENEMISLEIANKKAGSMGHIPLSGKEGLIHYLHEYTNKRKILTHINNTNPILNENSIQYKMLLEHAIEVAEDGMEINL